MTLALNIADRRGVDLDFMTYLRASLMIPSVTIAIGVACLT